MALGRTCDVVLQSTTLHLWANRVLGDVHTTGEGQRVFVGQAEADISLIASVVNKANFVFYVEVGFLEGNIQCYTIKSGSQSQGSKVSKSEADVVSLLCIICSSQGHVPLCRQGRTFHHVISSLTGSEVPVAAEVGHFDAFALYQGHFYISKAGSNSGCAVGMVTSYQREVGQCDSLGGRVEGVEDFAIRVALFKRISTLCIGHIHFTAPYVIVSVRVGYLDSVGSQINIVDFLYCSSTSQSLDFSIVDVL